MAEFIRREEAGETLDQAEWIAKHPDFADELRDFFGQRERANQRLGPLCFVAAQALHVRCPHCHNPIELLDDAKLDNISCPSCGSDRLTTGTGRTAWCNDCGAQVTDLVHPTDEYNEEWTCDECGQYMVLREEGSDERVHERQDLRAPKCSIHKAEMVSVRRAAMHVYREGEAS